MCYCLSLFETGSHVDQADLKFTVSKPGLECSSFCLGFPSACIMIMLAVPFGNPSHEREAHTKLFCMQECDGSPEENGPLLSVNHLAWSRVSVCAIPCSLKKRQIILVLKLGYLADLFSKRNDGCHFREKSDSICYQLYS